MKTHKVKFHHSFNVNFRFTVCGISTHKSITTVRWKRVTCKNCLKMKKRG